MNRDQEPFERLAGASASAREISGAIAGWRPRGVGDQAARFAREVVALAAPESPARARALLYAASRLAAFAQSRGLELRAELVLCPAVIERFVLEGCGSLSPATRRTLRTNLRQLARRACPDPRPAPTPLPRERSKRPYSDAEIAAYLALAAAQPTRARALRASALISLGAGAGLVGQELRHVSGADVIERSGGLLVVIGGERSRAVPVLARFHAPLKAAAAFAGKRYLVGGSDPKRKNLTCDLCAALSGDAALARLEPGRLRATWLSSCAQLIGLEAFMRAAGISCSQRLGDLVAALPQTDEREAVALLGGAA